MISRRDTPSQSGNPGGYHQKCWRFSLQAYLTLQPLPLPSSEFPSSGLARDMVHAHTHIHQKGLVPGPATTHQDSAIDTSKCCVISSFVIPGKPATLQLSQKRCSSVCLSSSHSSTSSRSSEDESLQMLRVIRAQSLRHVEALSSSEHCSCGEVSTCEGPHSGAA